MTWRRLVGESRSGATPLPLHEPKPKFRCHHYAVYGMACDEYDDLLWRAGDSCEICRKPAAELYKGRLCIDHDGRLGNGWNHVRGLLCPRCNSNLRYVDNGYRPPTPEQRRYLDEAWFLTGLPATHLELPWLPDPSPKSNRALSWKDNPNRRWNRGHRRYEQPCSTGCAH